MRNSKGMIDVSGKDITVRTARASGTIVLSNEVFEILQQGKCKKGNVLEIAKHSAISAVKATPSIVLMCHPILIEAIGVEFNYNSDKSSVTAEVTVKSSGKTGVEMEALVGASVACLSIYDMLKYMGKEMVISEVKLLEKSGGKSGDYKRES